MQNSSNLLISLCVVARNEERALPSLLSDILSQGYPHDRMEILLADSASTDGTRTCMERFAREHGQEFYGVRVLDNPGKTLARGWNVLLQAFTGDVILRVDAHANIPPDFVEKNAACLEKGEAVLRRAETLCAGFSHPMAKNLAFGGEFHVRKQHCFFSPECREDVRKVFISRRLPPGSF